MKFKLFFAMLLVFAGFTAVNAQSYVSPTEAVVRLKTALHQIETEAITISNTDQATLSAASKGIESRAHIYFISTVLEEVSALGNTQAGFDAAVDKLATDVPARQALLADAKAFTQNLITQ